MADTHEIDKNVAVLTEQVRNLTAIVKGLKETVEKLDSEVDTLKTENAKMLAFSKGRNWVIGLWCGATGVLCTCIVMFGQPILTKFLG